MQIALLRRSSAIINLSTSPILNSYICPRSGDAISSSFFHLHPRDLNGSHIRKVATGFVSQFRSRYMNSRFTVNLKTIEEVLVIDLIEPIGGFYAPSESHTACRTRRYS
jgi:hypothetical protein